MPDVPGLPTTFLPAAVKDLPHDLRVMRGLLPAVDVFCRIGVERAGEAGKGVLL